VPTAVPCAPAASHLLSDRFRPFPHVVWARQADATVLLDAERGLYYTLNEVAGRTWELLAAGEPLIEILRCLGDEYEATPETLQADASDLLGHLLEARLIERLPS
jgi:chromosome condensin MukBEF complex kleisin-like MukF subunit